MGEREGERAGRRRRRRRLRHGIIFIMIINNHLNLSVSIPMQASPPGKKKRFPQKY